MISLVLTTYNGKTNLTEQLDSIRRQTLQPDEVIIRDDGSVDGTVNLVETYIKKYNLVTWNYIHGQINVGWKRNFYEAIKLAQGDLIFLCDQDDIWHEDKVESMVHVMDSYPKIELLASGYHSFYEGEANKLTLRGDRVSDGSISKVKFDKKFLTVSYPGCTYCFRNKLKRPFFEHWFEESSHDALLWVLANQMDGLYIYNQILMEYRRHTNCATNSIKTNRKNEQINSYKRRIILINILLKIEKDESRKEFLNKVLKLYNLRLGLLNESKKRNLVRILRYLPYYGNPKHYVLDAKLALFGG